MRLPKLKTLILACALLFGAVYGTAAIFLALDDQTIPVLRDDRASYHTVTIFGASGTAGDGILKAALADADIEKIHVVTRRVTPRIEAGVAGGKVQMTMHTDYTDYTALRDQIADSDAVYWAIGTSSVGVDEAIYAKIHVDFPMRFVEHWVSVSSKPNISFHYISSSDISENSRMMWARQKVRAERSLFDFANGRKLKVIAYRPDYIGPTKEEAHVGQDLLFWFFRPVGAAVRARQIGQAMIEVSARESEFKNGDKLGTLSIILYSDAYEQSQQ